MAEFRRRHGRRNRQRGAFAMLVAASLLCAWTTMRPERVRTQELAVGTGFVMAVKMQRCLPCANHYDQAVNCHQGSAVKALY